MHHSRITWVSGNDKYHELFQIIPQISNLGIESILHVFDACQLNNAFVQRDFSLYVSTTLDLPLNCDTNFAKC